MDKMIRINMLIWIYSTSLVIIGSFIPVQATTGSIGEIFQADTIKTGVQGIFIQEKYVIPEECAIYQFSAYVVERTPAWFQIWRPENSNPEVKQYRLIGQLKISPQYAYMVYNVSVPRQFPIFAQAGDVLGIYNEEDVCPFDYIFTPGMSSRMYHSQVSEGTQVKPDFLARFGSMPFPFNFAIQAHYDTDVEKYKGPFDPLDSTTNTSPTQIPELPRVSGTFLYTGNSLAARTNVMAEFAQGMYLIPHLEFKRGVVVKFYASFLRKAPTVFQIWRPHPKVNGVYMLVGEHRYEPELVPIWKEIQLENGNYIFVEDGDILGISFTTFVGSIAYRFALNPDKAGCYSSSIVNNKLPERGEAVTFNTYVYPYDFAVGAIYDTDLNPAKYGSPPPTIIPHLPTSPTQPRETDTLSPVQPNTPISINVPDGANLLGEQYLHEATSVLQNGALRSFIVPELRFTSSGKVVSFYAYIVQNGRVKFQIWRNDGNSRSYKLVGQKEANIITEGAEVSPKLQEIKLEDGDNIFVKAGDCVGFANLQQISVIGYRFQSSVLYTSEAGHNANLGDMLPFDRLSFPYKFSVGAAYVEDNGVTTSLDDSVTTPNVDTTKTCIVVTSRTSGVSTTRTSGVSTTQTSGQVNQPQAQKSEDTDNFSWVMDSGFIFGLLVWLIILTVLFFMLLICLICVHKQNTKKEENKRTSFLYDYQSRNSVTHTPAAYLRHGPIDDKETMNYFNPKTGSRSGPVMRNDSMKEKLIECDESEEGDTRFGNINNNNRTVADIENNLGDGRVTLISSSGDMSTHM